MLFFSLIEDCRGFFVYCPYFNEREIVVKNAPSCNLESCGVVFKHEVSLCPIVAFRNGTLEEFVNSDMVNLPLHGMV